MIKITRMQRALAASVAVAALGAPTTALAKFNLESTGSPPPAPARSPAPVAQPPVPGAGFQWSDAGIGAAGAVLVLGTGALVYVAPRRSRRGARAV